MAGEMKHTPTPWLAHERFDEHGGTLIVYRGGNDDYHIADCSVQFNGQDSGQNAKNAAFIVRAANSHDELVAALRDIEAICTENNATFRKRMGTRVGNALVAARGYLSTPEGRADDRPFEQAPFWVWSDCYSDREQVRADVSSACAVFAKLSA